jgi:ribonuclease-3
MVRRRPVRSASAAPVGLDEDIAREVSRLDRAEALLGYRFRDRRLLLSALTHASWRNEQPTETPDNEVLELLGDAVLSLVVVDELVRDMVPGVGEGELTERRAAHVSAEALARAASAIGLDGLLRTERGLHERRPLNVVADVVEAVIGAVWRDAGDDALPACRALVGRLLGSPPTRVEPTGLRAKRRLQERLQRLFGRPPDYVVDRREGPNHAPTFVASARFDGEILGTATGTNKRLATEAAAAAACALLEGVDDQALMRRFPRTRP